MLSLTKTLLAEREFAQLISRIDAGGCPAVISGLSEIHRSHAVAALRAETGRPVTVICADATEAARMARDIEALSGEAATVLGEREFTFYNAEVVSRQLEQRRISVFCALNDGRVPVLVTTVSGLMQRCIPPHVLRSAAVALKNGGEYDLAEITQKLVQSGYTQIGRAHV